MVVNSQKPVTLTEVGKERAIKAIRIYALIIKSGFIHSNLDQLSTRSTIALQGVSVLIKTNNKHSYQNLK